MYFHTSHLICLKLYKISSASSDYATRKFLMVSGKLEVSDSLHFCFGGKGIVTDTKSAKVDQARFMNRQSDITCIHGYLKKKT